MEPITIKNWAMDDRPREKLLHKGRNAVSDVELLALIIGSGNRRHSAVDLSRQILQSCEYSFARLSKLSIDDLQDFKGIGRAKAISIYASLEIARRRYAEQDGTDRTIITSRDAYVHLSDKFQDLVHEEFHVIYLNRGNRLLSSEQVSKGGLSGTVADGKLIFHRALQLKASGVILAHNHPSGQLKPSEADLRLTSSLVSFGNYIDLQVLDHLIFCDNAYFSFADAGLISR
jgi:DNA repair protein RadC